MDVGTAAFIIDGIVPGEQLRELGSRVLASAAATRTSTNIAQFEAGA